MDEAQSRHTAPTAEKALDSCQPGQNPSRSHQLANELRRDLWDFAVEVHNLRAAGLTDNELRWLVCNDYVEHAIETTRPHAANAPLSGQKTSCCPSSCFVPTPTGVVLVAGTLAVRENEGAWTRLPPPPSCGRAHAHPVLERRLSRAASARQSSNGSAFPPSIRNWSWRHLKPKAGRRASTTPSLQPMTTPSNVCRHHQAVE